MCEVKHQLRVRWEFLFIMEKAKKTDFLFLKPVFWKENIQRYVDYCLIKKSITLKYFFKNKIVSERKNQFFKGFSLNKNFTIIYTLLIMILIMMWAIIMGWHLLIKKCSPRSWLFFWGPGHFYFSLPLRKQSSNSAQALCGGWRMDLILTSFLIGWKMDVWKPAVPPLLSHVGFVLEQCWFSDPTFSFLPRGDLMEFKKPNKLVFFFFFLPIYFNQWVNYLSFSTASGLLCVFTYLLPYDASSARFLEWLSTLSSFLLFGKKKKRFSCLVQILVAALTDKACLGMMWFIPVTSSYKLNIC